MRQTLVLLQLTVAVYARVALEDLFPFGQSNGDAVINLANIDGSSPPVNLGIAFPLFDYLHDVLWVNVNGGISFIRTISDYQAICTPLPANYRMIAPYWSDIALGNQNNIFYRVSTEPSVLQKMTALTRSAFPQFTRLELKWTFIATWHNVTFYLCCTCGRPANTYQVALTTDGVHSFVFFLYNQIEWTTSMYPSQQGNCSGLGGHPAKATIDAGDGKSMYVVPGSCTDDIVTIDERSNIGQPGVWAFRVDSADVQSAGCEMDFKGQLQVAPVFIDSYGNEPISLTGPCFDDTMTLGCRFYPFRNSDFVEVQPIINYTTTTLYCMAPFMYVLGRTTVELTITSSNGTKSYSGSLYVIKSQDDMDKLIWHLTAISNATFNANLTWRPELLGSPTLIDINLYRMNSTSQRWIKEDTLAVNVSNTGTYNAVLQYSQIFTNIDRTMINFAIEPSIGQHVRQRSALGDEFYKGMLLGVDAVDYLEAYLLDAATALNANMCQKWHDNDGGCPNDLISCPPTLLQSYADPRYGEDDSDCDCRIQITPSASGGAQQCCYGKDGNLRLGQQGGHAQKAHGDFFWITHFFDDTLPKKMCCQGQPAEVCQLYEDRRCQDDGSNYTAPQPAGGNGDPHLTTFDGLPYTFNGAGEFWMIRNSSDMPAAVQSRMEQFFDGTVPKLATTFTAFAFKVGASSTIQVQKSAVRTVDVYVDGLLLDMSNTVLYRMAVNQAQLIVAPDRSTVAVAFSQGFSFIVNTSPDAFSLLATCEPQYHNRKTAGLLGTFDGNPDNDLTGPDGVTLPTNSSLRDIHYNFGLKWKITQAESLFTYGGQTYSFYDHPEFVPSFVEPNLQNIPPAAQQICGDVRECLYDFINTNSASLANRTLIAVQAFNKTVETYSEKPLTCQRPVVANGVCSVDSLFPGNTATFTCDFGFSLKGAGVLYCDNAGNWNQSVPVCEKIADRPVTPSTVEPSSASVALVNYMLLVAWLMAAKFAGTPRIAAVLFFATFGVSSVQASMNVSSRALAPPCSERCNFYQCFEDKMHCGPKRGYFLNYAKRTCENYLADYANFDAAGQRFIDLTRDCLINFLIPYYESAPNNGLTCCDIKALAFASHEDCYLNSGFCEALLSNPWQITKIIYQSMAAFNTWGSLQQVFAIAGGCVTLEVRKHLYCPVCMKIVANAANAAQGDSILAILKRSIKVECELLGILSLHCTASFNLDTGAIMSQLLHVAVDDLCRNVQYCN